MTKVLAPVRPETVGFSGDRLKQLDDHFRRNYIDSGRLAGSVTLVQRRGQLAHCSVLGQADRERATPMRGDSLVRIYSMAKPLASVLFMMLVEEGKVGLDDPVHRYIPEWTDLGVYEGGCAGNFSTRSPDRPMLIADLLRHTAGLTYGFAERTPVDAAYRAAGIGIAGEKKYDLAQTVEILAGLPLEFSPGQQFNYSMATDVVGYLIGLIDGQPFEEAMKRRLLIPLAMNDTDFQVPAGATDRLAACYRRDLEGRTLLQDDPRTSSYLTPPIFVSGGGGMVSTAGDYLRFCRMMLNGGELDGARILSPKTVQLMTANHLPRGADLPEVSTGRFRQVGYAGVGFGLGFGVVMDPAQRLLPGSRGEYFWGGATGSYFWVDPMEDMIVVFMTQLMSFDTLPVRRDLRNLVYASLEDAAADSQPM